MHYEPACLCDDYSSCTEEFCDPVNGCVYINVDCDDGNSYTWDYCDNVMGCVHEEIKYEAPTEGGY